MAAAHDESKAARHRRNVLLGGVRWKTHACPVAGSLPCKTGIFDPSPAPVPVITHVRSRSSLWITLRRCACPVAALVPIHACPVAHSRMSGRAHHYTYISQLVRTCTMSLRCARFSSSHVGSSSHRQTALALQGPPNMSPLTSHNIEGEVDPRRWRYHSGSLRRTFFDDLGKAGWITVFPRRLAEDGIHADPNDSNRRRGSTQAPQCSPRCI
jgi:hypothetical protein